MGLSPFSKPIEQKKNIHNFSKKIIRSQKLQSRCLAVRNIRESGHLPGVLGWSSGEAVFHMDRFFVLDVNHQIKVAHFVHVGRADESVAVSGALHRAPRSERVTLSRGDVSMNRIEHLRCERIALAELYPLAARSDEITGYYFAERVSVDSVGERMDSLVLVQLASRLHVLGRVRRYHPGGAEQYDTRQLV